MATIGEMIQVQNLNEEFRARLEMLKFESRVESLVEKALGFHKAQKIIGKLQQELVALVNDPAGFDRDQHQVLVSAIRDIKDAHGVR